MKVEKTELKERLFIPYKITLLIDDKSDHENLKRDILEIESILRDRWYRFSHGSNRYSAITGLINEIKKHVF